MAIPTVSEAKNVTLSWDPSPTQSVSGYTLYWSTDSSIPIQDRSAVDCGMVLNQVVVNLADNETHYFAVTAHDASDNESVYSNIVFSDPIEAEPLPDLNLDIEWQLLMGGR